MGKILKILFNCLLVLIILVLISYFSLRMMNKIRIYNVETGSMEDKIHPGDYILLLKRDNYQVGDVITFKINDYFITHRIIKIENGKLTTKGDANNMEDAEITFDQIEGKAIYWGGALNFIIKYKFVLAAFILGLYLLSCYFGDGEDKIVFNENSDENKTEPNEEIKEETIEEKKNDISEENIIIEEILDDEEKKEEIIIEDIIGNEEEKKEEIEVIEEIKEEKLEKKKQTPKAKKSSEDKTPKAKKPSKKTKSSKTNSKTKKSSTKTSTKKGSKKKSTKKK